MDSKLDFGTKGPGFNSRLLLILFTSFFLLCQVLSETNFSCISTSNFPCECTKKLHQLFQKPLPRPPRPAFGRLAGAASWDNWGYIWLAKGKPRPKIWLIFKRLNKYPSDFQLRSTNLFPLFQKFSAGNLYLIKFNAKRRISISTKLNTAYFLHVYFLCGFF